MKESFFDTWDVVTYQIVSAPITDAYGLGLLADFMTNRPHDRTEPIIGGRR